MAVKVVTDSTCDIPVSLARELGVTVVPLYVHFGAEAYRDGVDLSTEAFYQKLATNSVLPVTATVPPALLAELYDQVAQGTDEIISIHLSSKLSATYENALMAKELVKSGCRVEVIDSKLIIMALGFGVIAAAKAAQAGANLDQVVEVVRSIFDRSHALMVFDTLEYLQRGGRIGRARALLGSLLRINPLITLKDGEVYPAGRVRTRAKAMESLYEFVNSFTKIEGLAVEDATTPDEADELCLRLAPLFPNESIYRSKVSPVVGTHVGPHVIAVSVLEGER